MLMEKAMAPVVQPASTAQGVCWNLADLYRGLNDPAIEGDLEAALARAQRFETAYRGKIETADAGSAPLLRTALEELENLSEQMDKPVIYASLVHAAKTDDPRHGALLARTREQRTAINKHLI